MGAKICSKLSMIFSSIWVSVLTILKGSGKINLEVTDIIYSGIAIVAMWSSTYLSICLDKIKDINFGSGGEK